MLYQLVDTGHSFFYFLSIPFFKLQVSSYSPSDRYVKYSSRKEVEEQPSIFFFFFVGHCFWPRHLITPQLTSATIHFPSLESIIKITSTRT